MRRLTQYRTRDGLCFDTEEAARNHIDEKYGELILHTAKRIAACDRYSAAIPLAESLVDVYATLAAYKADKILENPSEECDCHAQD